MSAIAEKLNLGGRRDSFFSQKKPFFSAAPLRDELGFESPSVISKKSNVVAEANSIIRNHASDFLTGSEPVVLQRMGRNLNNEDFRVAMNRHREDEARKRQEFKLKQLRSETPYGSVVRRPEGSEGVLSQLNREPQSQNTNQGYG